ncbi:MAG: class I SAM-dependent methyltransferase [bacterium]|nr:class I SAM-dependent methyltransferase [bacterium]MCY4102947.1 class I SAM-dependent methyltransferase [bacterium]
MSSQITQIDEALLAYMDAHSSPPDAVQRDLIAVTEALGDAGRMQIGAVQGSFMMMLVRLLQPRLAVEVGTFTGYSALAVAKGLPPGGRLLCCDVSVEWTAIARSYWERAGVADRIDLRIAPALETLRSLPPGPEVGFAFIDADKANYINYYEELLPRLSPQGIILVDNVLWGGGVANPDQDDDTTEALRAFNAHAAADPRSQVAMLPVGDGLTVITPG